MLITAQIIDTFISFYDTYYELEVIADIDVVVAVVIKRRKHKPKTERVKPWLEKQFELGVFKRVLLFICISGRLVIITSHKLSTSSQKAIKFSSCSIYLFTFSSHVLLLFEIYIFDFVFSTVSCETLLAVQFAVL